MKIAFALLIALLDCIMVCSQVVVGPSAAGFGNMNLANGAYALVNSMNYGNNYGQGFATFDPWGNRYIYTVWGGGGPDTLIVLNAVDGAVMSKHPYPSQGLFNPQYCGLSNKVLGFHATGFASFDLSTSTYTIINNQDYGNGYGQGLNTINPSNCVYIYTIHGAAFSDTLVLLDPGTGNFLQKIHFPQDGLFNPEFSQLSNSVFGIATTGFAKLDLSTGSYSVIGAGNFGSGAIQGISAFDQSNYHYLFSYAGAPPSDTLCVIHAATGTVASKFPFPKDHLFNFQYAKMNPLVSTGPDPLLGRFSIGPNPTSGVLRMDLQGGTCDILIMDPMGKVVFANPQFSGSEIDLVALAPGSYVAQVAMDGHSRWLKIIKL